MTQNCSQESHPPQKTKSDERSQKAFDITKNVKKSNEQTLQELNSKDDTIPTKGMCEVTTEAFEQPPTLEEVGDKLETPSAEEKELTALREYIFDNGFVVSTVAFHIVALCAQPMVTPATTNWDFEDRALIPDMVFALLKQPGYLEGIWPSLRIIMGTNKGNAAWCSAIAMTIAFFDVIRALPVVEEMKT